MIPSKLSEWNYKVVKQLAEKYLETDKFDFKYQIRSRDPEYSKSIINTTCAFANTMGGFLVFGLHDIGAGRLEIEGVEWSDDLAKEFGDKIKSINPTVYFDFLNPPIEIPAKSKVVFVVYVPPSPDRPHMTDEGRFYYRTNEGNKIMSYEQVKESFLRYEERRHKMNLLYIELISNLSVAKGMLVTEQIDTNYSLLSFDTDVISDLLPDIYSIIQTDRELVQLLVRLRIQMSIVNSKIRMFHSQMIMPLSNLKELTRSHNEYVRNQIDTIILPLTTNILNILESRFELRNPLDGAQR